MSEVFRPFEYQNSMTQWLLDHEEASLFVSMGLGKTVATLSAISDLILNGAAKGCLLVAPIRVMAITWPDQVARWEHTSWMRIANMRTPEGIDAWERGAAEIYMINPEMLPSITRVVKCPKCGGRKCDYCKTGKTVETHFKDRPVKVTRSGEAKPGQITRRRAGWVEHYLKTRKKLPVDIFVLDESTLAKSKDSKRFEQLRVFLHDLPSRKYKTPFKRRWSLTGSPAPNDYSELFAQIRLLDNGARLGAYITHFRNQYCYPAGPYKWEFRDGAKERIDEKISDLALVMLGDDWLDLPATTTIDVDVTLPKDAADSYETLETHFLVQLETGEIEALSAAALVTKLLQFSAGCAYDVEKEVHCLHEAKLKALAKIRKAHPKEPLLVLTSFIHERERLLKKFPEAEEFDEKGMDRWRAGNIPMWVGDARSLCHGIDGLQVSCSTVVWMTLPFSNEVFQQANARLIRMGQEHETRIYRIIARGTVDEAIAEVLRNREEQQDTLMRSIKALQALRATPDVRNNKTA